ncbi:hypothetical protein LL912_25070 [Niabella sp. CC-SYL272]|uniref:hypothetical protein n=1 Tax=Niabella agricola TaxID=2891571 RepID=UPI001F266375|nr:hypothetical protein [Niabella agricola]MCF3112084.1 hypothetical protein [Niabella agricola]
MIKKILHHARSPILGCLLAFLFTSLAANAQQKKAVSGNVTAAAGARCKGYLLR